MGPASSHETFNSSFLWLVGDEVVREIWSVRGLGQEGGGSPPLRWRGRGQDLRVVIGR